ncbi:polysaccharide deacetylase family protein [Mucilaginibacter pineti]|nr:polysaccharide deacetylase family protein [Mucilaginibacter pineti]
MKKLIIIFLLSNLCVQAQQQVKWPEHKKAAIVLTYDDALPSQLNNAVPELKRAGLKATFFLTSDIDSLSIPRWRKLAAAGFELGNHTVFHPCAGIDDNPVPSEPYSAYRIIREIEVMDRFLFAVDGKTKRTFAYPCAETFVGGKDYVDSLRKYTLVKYARVGGDSSAVITDFRKLDTLRVPSYGLDGGESGKQLVAFVKSVEEKGGLGVIMFHGIGGDYITVSREAHRELIRYLRQHNKTIWVPTFRQVLDEAYRQIKRPKASPSLTK